MSLVKKILIVFLLLLICFLGINYELLRYGISLARGQIEIVKNARPNAEVLIDPDFPDSLKTNLRLVDAIKKFAFDSLGINYSTNYSKVYDQKGKELMFVVTACEPFKLEPKEWTFPLVGTFSYKGFFDLEKANSLENKLKAEGLDTNIRTAGGWSTLGWFEDPILSNMLDDDEAGFAELIIHELTHGTLFVKDSLRFNENLATFIGIKGTERYLSMKYGKDNVLLKNYQNLWKDRNKISNHILKGAQFLDSVYNAIDTGFTIAQKYKIKENTIHKILDSVDTLELHHKQQYIEYYNRSKPNNTFFMSYLRYRGDYALLENELIEKYNGDIKKMLEDYKSKYPSL